MKTHTLLLAAALTLMASAAHAQNATVYGGITTDYVSRGSTQNMHDPVVSLGGEYRFGDSGFYVGAWTAHVDFGDGTDQELDFFAGYRTEVSGWALDLGLASYNYLGDPETGQLDMVEGIAVASRTFGKVTPSFTLAYSKDYFGFAGDSIWAEAQVAYAVSDKLSLSTAYGYQEIENDSFATGGFPSYGTWNVGATYALTPKLSVDVRYTDNDLDPSSGNLADDTLVGSLNYTF